MEEKRKTNYTRHWRNHYRYMRYQKNYKELLVKKRKFMYSKQYQYVNDYYNMEDVHYFVIYDSFLKYLKNLSHNQLKVYLYLCSIATVKTGFCKFLVSDICYYLDISRLTCKRCLTELRKIRLIYFESYPPDPIEIEEEPLNELSGLDDSVEVQRTYKPSKEFEYILALLPYGIKEIPESVEISQMQSDYADWISQMKLERMPFNMIPVQFINYWEKLRYGGSVKLLIHSYIQAHKKYGDHYRSLETISKELNTSRKTISLWFKDLKDNKLIDRYQLVYSNSSTTHLLPMGKVQHLFFKYKIYAIKTTKTIKRLNNKSK